MSARRLPLSRAPQRATIDGFTHGGEGVARIEGKAVFVPGALPGEVVDLRVVDDRKRWGRASLLDVVEASPDRAAPDDPQRHVCGGCDLEHVTPEGQLRLKARVVREQLERLGKLVDPPVAAARAVGPAAGYRTRTRLHADADGRLGFHRPGTHEVLAGPCAALAPAVQSLRHQVGESTGAAAVELRAHGRTGAAAVVLVPGPGPLHTPDGDFDLLLEQPDGRTLTVRGDGVLQEHVHDHTYRFDVTSFFQGNTDGADALVREVLRAGGEVDGALVWDLYAGVGLLSLPLAAAGAEVVAVEGHEPAADWARTNADEAGLGPGGAGGTVDVRAAPVAHHTRTAREATTADPPDLVVLDPPRTGAGAEVIADLVALAPATVVYVSCDPAALARDARGLIDGGYHLTQAVPLDLFPLTSHVETVATFAR